MNDTQKSVTCFCPECKQETFQVTVTNSGSQFNHYWGQIDYWFEGQGVCTECGYQGYYSDSSL